MVEADSNPNPESLRKGFVADTSKRQHLQSGLYRTTDGGATWTKMNPDDDRPFYFSQVGVDPRNPDRVYWMGTQLYFSNDGGRTPRRVGQSIHVDNHAFWVDPEDPDHYLVGEDGGLADHLGPRPHLRRDHADAGGPVLRHRARHAGAVLDLRRAAGQRLLVRAEPHQPPGRHPEPGLVQRGRRRRLLRRRGPHRPEHRCTPSRRAAASRGSTSGPGRASRSGRAARRCRGCWRIRSSSPAATRRPPSRRTSSAR